MIKEAVLNGPWTELFGIVEASGSDVKNLDANGSASHPIHLHPPNRNWIST